MNAAAVLLLIAAHGSGPEAPVYPSFGAIDQRTTTCIVIGDTQRTSNWEFWRAANFEETQKLLIEIARRRPGLVLHLGDMTARGSSEKHWEYFDRWTKPIFDARIPIFPVLGNHEYYGGNRTALANVTARFPHLREKTWYRVTFKEVGGIMLNSNLDELSEAGQKAQLEWYRQELDRMEKDPAVRAIFVCCHHPPFSNGKVVGRSETVEKAFVPPFVKAKKTAFFLSGHCHSYERFARDGKQFIVSGGGGGPRHRLDTDPESRKYQDACDGPAVRPFHFCEIEIPASGLLLRVVALKEGGGFDVIDRVAFPFAHQEGAAIAPPR